MVDNTKSCFECERCGFCCKLEVRLSQEDIGRIMKTGYNSEDFVVNRNGENFLRQIDGACIFLLKNMCCSIYAYRPDVCRRFPFNKNSNRMSYKCKKSDNTFNKKVFQRFIELQS